MRRVARALAAAALGLAALVAAGIALSWAPDVPVESLAARWAGPPSTFVEVDGLRVHLRDEGPRDDPLPIVLLHGTSASLHTWDGWAAALRERRRVIRFDLPGFGLTGPNATGDYREATYARFVVAVLDALAVPRCVLGGNSLGGEVAWRTALAAPERIASLILVDSAGYAFVPRSIPLGFRLARIPVLNKLAENTLPRALVAASVRNVYGDPARVDDALIDRYRDMTLRAGNRAALVQRLAQFDGGASQERIATIRQPTLILWGGRDRLIPPENAGRFARDIAGSRLELFESLGHVPHEEDPLRTVEAVQRFLGER